MGREKYDDVNLMGRPAAYMDLAPRMLCRSTPSDHRTQYVSHLLLVVENLESAVCARKGNYVSQRDHLASPQMNRGKNPMQKESKRMGTWIGFHMIPSAKNPEMSAVTDW